MGYTISNYIGTVLNLHSIYRRPMSKSSLLAICRMAELLKSIQYTFHRRSMIVTHFLNLAIDQFEIRILLILDTTTVRQHACVCIGVSVMCELMYTTCFYSPR